MTPETIRGLYNFIDAIIRLPEPLAIEYDKIMYNFEEGSNMHYVSRLELKGMEKGIEKRNKEIVQRMLQKGYSKEIISELTGLSEDVINTLAQHELVA